ncbi:hypothetical protein [Clostridium saccharoperbutylacetonicum]|uniref:N-acetylmuramoyl-L-alanine amidase family protein n=1 Tax=Clostridium saccharoperbutylacetonicum TaxID=36745 RepID=UPI0039E82F59
MLNRIRKRNKAIAVALAITAITQGLPIVAVNAAVTATATAQVAGSMGTITRSYTGGVSIDYDYTYSYSDPPTGLWGDSNYSATYIGEESSSAHSSTHKTYTDKYILLAQAGARVNFSRALSNQYNIGVGLGGNGNNINFNATSGGGFSLSFIMPSAQVQGAFFFSHHYHPSDDSYNESYALVPITNIDMGNPSSEQASKAQQSLLNYKANNGTTIADLQAIANNSIDTSKFIVNVSQTVRQDATESSDGMLSGNLVVTENSSGKQTTSSFAMQIAKLGQSFDTISSSLGSFIKNYNAVNNSNPNDFINSIKITNPAYSISVSDWSLQPANDTQEGKLNCNVYLNENGNVRQKFPVDKKVSKLPTTTPTAKTIIESIVNNYAASNRADQNVLLDTCKKAVGNNITVNILNWNLKQSTETIKGLLTASISITDGLTTDSVPINKEIYVQEQSVSTISSLYETDLKNFKATNDTKPEDILNNVIITNQDIKADISDFNIMPANEGKSGKINGNINISNKVTGENQVVPIDVKIAQLPQSVETVKSLYEKALGNYVATNDSQKEDILGLVYVNNEDISVSMQDDYSIKYANDTDKGLVSGTILIKNKNGDTAEAPLNKEIGLLSQGLSTSVRLVQNVIYGYNPTNSSTFEDLLRKCNDVVTKNINIYYKIGEQPEKIDSTEFDEGHMKGTMVITDGSNTIELPFNITISKTPQTVPGAKTLIEACLKSFKATNDTTPQMILNAVQTNVRTDSISVAFGSSEGEAFNKINATIFKSGKITGAIYVSNSTDNVKVPVDLSIDMLDQNIDQAGQAIDALLPNIIVSNDTEEADIKKQIQDVVAPNIYVTTTGFQKSKATLDNDGLIKVNVILLDKNTQATKEIPLQLIIKKLQESLSDATKAVEQAEQSKSQSDVDAARKEVDRLPDGTDKSALENRLDKVQDIIDATKAVEKAEQSKSQADADAAKQAIDKLPDGPDKKALEDRINQVEQTINQELQDAKAKAEATLSNFNASNSTIEQNVIDAVKGNISNPSVTVQFGTGDNEPFNKKDADINNAGSITGVIIIKNGSNSVTVPVNLPIAKTNPTNTNTSSGGSSGGSSSSSKSKTEDVSIASSTNTVAQANIGWKNVNGIWYYYKPDGSFLTGWQQLEGTWYYFDYNGILKTGWFKDIDGNWYYLDPTPGQTLGAMQIGWKKVDNYWYFLNMNVGDPQGSMETGWKKVDGNWFDLNQDGSMRTGWIKDTDGNWYYLQSNGVMVTGWNPIDGKWYHFKADGAMLTGWFEDNDKWSYLNQDGSMRVGWFNDNGTWYYLSYSGVMVHDAYISGYYLGSDGAWVQ